MLVCYCSVKANIVIIAIFGLKNIIHCVFVCIKTHRLDNVHKYTVYPTWFSTWNKQTKQMNQYGDSRSIIYCVDAYVLILLFRKYNINCRKVCSDFNAQHYIRYKI